LTDTRLPEQWLLNRDLDKLSDAAWRVLTRAMIDCNSQGTDGEIDEMYLHHIYPWRDPRPHLEEIIAIGWMVRTGSGYLIPDWEAKGQSTAAQMDEYREKTRSKQQRYRDKNKAPTAAPVTDDVTGDVTGDVGEARHKDRQGEASDMKVSWPVVEIPTKDTDLTIREGEIL
jgi:hypothetical protein